MAAASSTAKLEKLVPSAYVIPTDAPESGGTLAWDKTTLVVVLAHAGGQVGLGYTYGSRGSVEIVRDTLAPVLLGTDAMAVGKAWTAMWRSIRNLGTGGVAAMAISAVDAALWDLKARLLGLPLCTLLGRVRPVVPIYGSGGFTSYSERQLREQLGGWARQGIGRVKMKVGREPAQDPARARAAREEIGPHTELFVDANGAYRRQQARAMAQAFAEFDVRWFEEPVSSEDLPGLRLLRGQVPAGMEVAAGEYGFSLPYFRRMLAAEAVDVLQADATRCGITGLLSVGELTRAYQLDLSAHCAPALHVHPCCAVERLRHLEYFHDHVRIEHLLFDGAPEPKDGVLEPDLGRPGLGLELKTADAERFLASS